MNLINLLSLIPNGKTVTLNTVSADVEKAYSINGDVESIRKMVSASVMYQEVESIEYEAFAEAFVITLKGFDN